MIPRAVSARVGDQFDRIQQGTEELRLKLSETLLDMLHLKVNFRILTSLHSFRVYNTLVLLYITSAKHQSGMEYMIIHDGDTWWVHGINLYRQLTPYVVPGRQDRCAFPDKR